MATTKVFRSGNSQAVRIPWEFQLNSGEVEITRRGDEIVIREPPRSRLRRIIPVQPLDEAVAIHYGCLRTELEKKGRPIGSYDLLIAAHALSLGLTLVTNNVREFARVDGLRLDNWASPGPEEA